MANTKSSKARIKTNERDRQKNQSLHSALKTMIKKTSIAIKTNAPEINGLMKQSVKALDKAVTKGLLHKNTAARKKSRLMKSANSKKSS